MSGSDDGVGGGGGVENPQDISVDRSINSSATTTATSPDGKNKQHTTQERSHCLVCYSDLRGGSGGSSNKQVAAAGITPCHHDDICGLCHLRLRQLHSDTKCPICKADNEVVIVDYVNNKSSSSSSSSSSKKQFEDYPVWGENLGQDFIFVRGMFFPVAYYHSTVKPLSSYQCTVKECGFATAATEVDADGDATKTANGASNKPQAPATGNKGNQSLRSLQDHLRTQHRLTLCQLCVDNKRDFVARLPRYSPSGLQKHITGGVTAAPTNGGGTGAGSPPQQQQHNQGHPVCEFCRPQRFYDVTALHMHLNQEHYKCHVCEIAGSPNQFFKNYRSLERHFDLQHFLCHDAQCVQARFVVFANELDLRLHERQVHGGNGTLSSAAGSTKIQLEFRVARRGGEGGGGMHQDAPDASDFNFALDGTAFVPAALPSTQDSLFHPQHVARTEELRQQAAIIRQQNDESNGADDDFPTLQATVAASEQQAQNNNRLTIGWTADGALNRVGRQKPAGAVTEEDFPSLMATAPKKQSTSTSALSVLNKKPAAASSAGWTSGAAAVAPSYPRTITPMFNSSGSGSISTGINPTRSTTATSTGTAKVDLSTENFPSLGPATASARPAALYTAAQAYAKKNASNTISNAQHHLAADNFPALGGHVKTSARAVTAKNHPNNAQHLAADNFPALSGGTRSSVGLSNSSSSSRAGAGAGANAVYAAAEAMAQKQAREKALASTPQWNSASDFPPPKAAGAASVEDMKAALGPAAFKQLKKFTREFATSELAADAYVDHAASLFPQGYADANFWIFVPALVDSCPPSADKDAASRYMDNLKRMRNGALNAEAAFASSQAKPAAPVVSHQKQSVDWSANSNVTAAPPLPRVTAAIPTGRYVPPPSAYARAPVASNKKAVSAWGGSGVATSTVVRAQPLATSVAGASAAAPSRATATSFMAKEAKEEMWQQSNAVKSGTNKKKNKQKNELKSLAFGS